MKQIRKHFEQLIQQKLSDNEWLIFASKLYRQQFPKNKILLKTGQVEDHLSFVETGVIRFYMPRLENDLTFAFAFENEFVSGYDSFLTRSPSNHQIETLSKTTLWRISFNDLQYIYHKTAIGNLIGRKASEELFIKKSKRELSLLNETAEERYRNLFEEKPQLIKHIPLKYVASYIGITPQFLSIIRKRIN